LSVPVLARSRKGRKARPRPFFVCIPNPQTTFSCLSLRGHFETGFKAKKLNKTK
jgi:hypothetical protein